VHTHFFLASKVFYLTKISHVFYILSTSDKENEETQAYDRKCADIFQMNNGSLYTSKPHHELD
jgi:hypothetical protein